MVRVVIAVSLVLAAAGCASAEDETTRRALMGTWVTQGQPEPVTMTLAEDGTFTWSVENLSGGWTVEGTTLTLAFPSESAWCPDGDIVWEFELSEDTLTADVTGGECGKPGPPSPDWIFNRVAV